MADKDHPDYYNGAIDEDVRDRAFDHDLNIGETYEDRAFAPRDDDDHDYNEEVAAEATFDRRLVDDRDDDDDVAGGTGIGWLSLVLSVIGLFFLPVIMGAAGIIIGIIARRQGARALGAWAIGIGIAAIVIKLFTAPFF
ncbi:MAG TPA: DUF4190 domain-containing protein [Sporolactobacillaceae bacterium]|nr:DUF4190 domain-containing protein [Sporolactobacillaceae bacterium]